MKLLITGCNGFVAGSIIVSATKEWELHGIGRSGLPPGADGKIVYHRADILDAQALEGILRSVRPDVIIHTAAIANIDFCESNQAMAEAVNVDATGRITEIAGDIGARLIFCSTDTVFDGRRTLYTEEDIPYPVNYYGATKVKAENLVLAAGNGNVVARLSLVMGWPVMGMGNTFLPDLVGRLQRGEPANFAVNEIRTPIDVLTLGEALNELAAGAFEGIIHMAGNTSVNRYDMARQIAVMAGFPPDSITPVNSNSFPGRAPRPDDASLKNTRARNILTTPMLDLGEALERCFRQNKK